MPLTFPFVLIIAFATILQGVTGFGYALIAIPLTLMLVSKTTSVTALVVTGVGLNAFLFWRLRTHASIDRPLFAYLLGSIVIGMPFGLWLLLAVDTHVLRIGAGICAIGFALLFYVHATVISRTRRATMLAGWIAGLLQASIGLIGPPIALLLSGQARPRDEIRKTLAALFFIVNSITLPVFFATNTLSYRGVVLGIYSIPGALLGAFIGSKIARHVPQEHFKKLVYIIVFAAGCAAVYSGLEASVALSTPVTG